MADIKAIANREGYLNVRQMKNGQWIGIEIMIYTHRLCVGLNEYGYERGYCYHNLEDAIEAARTYEGEGDPSGPWIKMKGIDGEEMGPGAKGIR